MNNESWGPNIAPKRPADAHESYNPEMSPSDIKRLKVPQGASMPIMHEPFHPEMSSSDIKRRQAPQVTPVHIMRKAGAWGTRQNVHGRTEQHTGHVTIVRDPNRSTFGPDPNRSTIIRDPNRPHSGNIMYRNPRGGAQSSIIANKVVVRNQVEQNINQTRQEYFQEEPMFDYNSNPDIMSMENTGTYANAHRTFANRNRTTNVNREKPVSATVTSHSASNVSQFLDMDSLDEEMSPDDEEFEDSPTHITQIAHRGVSRTAVPLSGNHKDPIPTQMYVNNQEIAKRGLQHQTESRSSQEEPKTDATKSFSKSL